MEVRSGCGGDHQQPRGGPSPHYPSSCGLSRKRHGGESPPGFRWCEVLLQRKGTRVRRTGLQVVRWWPGQESHRTRALVSPAPRSAGCTPVAAGSLNWSLQLNDDKRYLQSIVFTKFLQHGPNTSIRPDTSPVCTGVIH